ncbi:MAG: 16S rRNA (adenine(1518)-N(6)/adenine(1519)-N(6))-dimethyltransferase [Phycisphaerales bacterium]|nr:16S rRNA (adenine(1518)-N(6)/adenine(1519)-N(6))-dimethyltransferase [Phycisphaerales bacterium]
MQSLSDIRALLESRGLSPKKSLGQNFLADQNLIRKLADAAELSPADLVLEVGPGTGVLTEAMLDRGCTVIACELDSDLAALLRERLADHPRFTLIEGDCLADKAHLNPLITEALSTALARTTSQATPGPLHAPHAPPGSTGGGSRGAGGFKLVANLPYQAASPLMVTLMCDHPACSGMWVTVQKEAADRARARPGTHDYGELAVVLGSMAEVRRVAVLPPECFWPRPKVTSEMIAVTRRPAPLTDHPRRLARACRALFTHRRKQLAAIIRDSARDGYRWNLPAPPAVLPAGINAAARPEQLTIEQLVALSAFLAE